MKNMKKLLQRAMVFTLSAAMLVGTPMTASAAGLVDLYSIGDGTGDYLKDKNPTGTITNTDTNTGFLISQNEARIVGIALDRETVNAEKFEPETLKATIMMDGTITAEYDYYSAEEPDKKVFSEGDDITQYVVDELSKKIKWEVVYTDTEGNVIPDSKGLPLPTDKVGLSGSAADRSEVTLNPKQGTKEGQEVTVRASIDASYYYAQSDGPQNTEKNLKQDDARKGIFYWADAKVSVKEYSTGLKWSDNPTEADKLPLKHTLDLGALLEREPETANDTITWTSSNTKAATVSATGVVTAKKALKDAEEDVTITAVSERGKVATRSLRTVTGVKADVVKVYSVSVSDNSLDEVTGKTTNKDLAVKADSTMQLKAKMYAKVTAVTADGKANGEVIQPVTGEDGKLVIPEGAKAAKNVVLEDGSSYIDDKGVAQTLEITDVITWTSNKKTVATVDADGKVTMVGVGTAAITAKATNGKSAKTTVKVAASLDSLEIDNAPTEAYSGQTFNLTATRKPSDANKDAVKWTVLAVDKDDATKTAKTKEASITNKGVLKIANKVTPGTKIRVTVETSKAVKTVKEGDTEKKIKVSASVDITLQQSNVDSITVKDASNATVACGGFDENGTKYAKNKGLVSETVNMNIPLKGTFVASTMSAGKSGDASKLTWKTSNAKVASLSTTAEGKVEIKAEGTGSAKITVSGVRVTTKNNKETASVISATFTVKVKQPVTSLTMNKPTVTLVQKDKTSKGKTTVQDQKVSLKVTFGPKKADKKQQEIASWKVVKTAKITGDSYSKTYLGTEDKKAKKASYTVTLPQPQVGDVYKITATSITGATATSTVTVVATPTEVAIANKVGTTVADDKVADLVWFSTKNKNGKDVLNTAELTIGSGKALQMLPVINLGTAEKKAKPESPANWVVAGTNKTEQVTYTVNKKGIVTLDSLGRVYPVKKGTVTITAKTANGKKATLKVTVK